MNGVGRAYATLNLAKKQINDKQHRWAIPLGWTLVNSIHKKIIGHTLKSN